MDAASWTVPRVWLRRWAPPLNELATGDRVAAPIGLLVADRAALVLERRPDEAETTIRAARRLLENRFQFFAYSEVRLPEPIDFSLDPLSGNRWPEQHTSRLDYRRQAGMDPKWIWELNRCQHLQLLCAAWLLSGERGFAEAAARGLAAWLGQSRPGRGIAWSNGFEAALRAISFAVTLDALRAYDGLDEELRALALVGLWQQARWTETHPSLHSSANNHRVAELAGLATIALLAPELRDSEARLERALRHLSTEIQRQILPDGTSAEQAFSYGLFVVDLVLLVVALLERCGHQAPPELLAGLDRAASALAAQADAGEPEQRYGDADDGHAFLVCAGRRTSLGVTAAIGAALGHPAARRVAPELDAAALWLFGADGLARHENTAPDVAPSGAYLPDGGLVVLRRGPRRITMDVGPLGYLRTAAHGHADALQVTVSERDRDLVVDPGVGSYFGQPLARSVFRSTAFHSTVAVDGRDQSQQGGPFLWTRRARVQVHHVDLERGVVVAEHDGYRALADPVSHRRALVVFEDGSCLVLDRLEGTKFHAYRQSWPIHPDLEPELLSDSIVRCKLDGDRSLLLVLAASSGGTITLERGASDPFRGWCSFGLESVVPCFHCAWETRAAGVVHLATLLAVGDEGGSMPRLSVAAEGTAIAVLNNTDLTVDVSSPRAPEIVVGSSRLHAS